MKNKNLLATLLILGITATWLSYTFADDTTTTDTTTVNWCDFDWKGFNWEKWKWFWMEWWMWGWMIDNLTDEEKTALESMTSEERQTFMETKRTEQEAKRESHETVIDKLLAWTSLTSDEETIRQEIIKQRAERKVEMETRKAEMEEMKTIMDKKKAGTTLTTEEQTKLDTFQSNRWGHRGGKR